MLFQSLKSKDLNFNMDNNRDTSCEPMEIDLSINSAMEISYTEHRVSSPIREFQKSVQNSFCASVGDEEDKDYFINVCDRQRKDLEISEYKWCCNFYKFVTIIPLIILLISFLSYNSLILKCHEELNMKFVKETFRSKIIGQTVAIENLIEALEMRNNNKLVILYGGTGVGKTLAAQLLLSNIVNYTNIYHYTMPALTFSSEVMFGFILCKSSIIIIDDITLNDTVIKTKIDEILSKSRNLQKKLTVILIYKCDINTKLNITCDNYFVAKLEGIFKHIQVYKSFIKFESLSKESLIKCIENELGEKKLNSQDLSSIMQNFNVELDGCKGVHQKMKYFNNL